VNTPASEYERQGVQAALRPSTEAMHMAPAQFDAVFAGGMPTAFITFLEHGAAPFIRTSDGKCE
jgi:hypothetical protein